MKPIVIRTFLGLVGGLLLVLPLAASNSFPPEPSAGTEIVAEIRNVDTNEPVIGVTVTLTGKLTTVAYESCITDDEGRVRMRVKKPGTYTVRVTSDNFERAEMDVTVLAGDRERMVLLLLIPKAAGTDNRTARDPI